MERKSLAILTQTKHTFQKIKNLDFGEFPARERVHITHRINTIDTTTKNSKKVSICKRKWETTSSMI